MCVYNSYLRPALVFLQRGDLSVPLALRGPVPLLLLFHLTHQCHLVDHMQHSRSSNELWYNTRLRKEDKKKLYFGLLHLSHILLELLELLLVLRLVLQEAGVLLLSRLELLQLFVHGAQLLLVLHFDLFSLFLRTGLH